MTTPVKGTSPGPDEWHHLEDLNQRRRIQNRLSQRNRRTNLRNQVAQGQKQETAKHSEPKQNRQLFWVPPNSSTAKGKLVTTKGNKLESPRPPDPVTPPGRWPEIWHASLHEKPSGGALHGDLGDDMDSCWINTLIRSPVLPIDDDMLSCTPPIPTFDTTMTLDAAPVPTAMPERDGGLSEGNTTHIQVPSANGVELGRTGGCKAPQDMHFTVQPQQPMTSIHTDKDRRDHFFGYAALHVAASRGHLAVVQLLTERGIPVDQLSSENETALHLAAEQGHCAVAHYLLERGADPHRGNQYGETALHVAAGHGHCDIVRLLFSYLPDLNIVDRNGHTALLRAVAEGHVDVVRVLLERGMDAGMKVGWPLDQKSI
ncbi:ankyrin repeat-containing domain protein [Aspergillus alliaceus]|uniref:Ankyrin repeat-containing domain protein n=1 Tax=Petromyces alliaceus TaxID=209559 RepID=A0A5N7BUQ8_PETAA|nr:ankyrin repeat-containing domain protein [Aspergillus alliaceus]